jgi:hypothetical protein
MPQNSELKELEQLYHSWPAAQLLRATTVERLDYKPEALALMDQELTRRGVSSSEKESHGKALLDVAEEDRKRLAGIKGVLLLFVVVVLVNSIALGWVGLAFAIDAVNLGFKGNLDWGNASLLFAIPFLILAGYGVFVFYVLLRKRGAAPRHAERFLISILVLIMLVVLVDSLDTYLSRHTFSFKGLLLIPGMCWIMPWLAYIDRSNRVANTYRHPHIGGELPH